MASLKINKKKKVVSIVSLVFLIVAVLAGIVLVQQNQNIREDAAGGCKFITDRGECTSSCGMVKPNGSVYKCKWDNRTGSCRDGNNLCDSGGGGGALTCAQLGGSCRGQGSAPCTQNIRATADCGGAAYCCYGTVASPIGTTHPSVCTHGATSSQICGIGQLLGNQLPCVKKVTKVCVYGSWEIRSRCGENNPNCF